MSTVTIPQALELAVQHHEAGRLREAEVIYRQILAVQPNHAETLHLLGLVAHRCGRHETAVDLIRRAIHCGFAGAVAHSNLGEAYRLLGRTDEAIAEYRRALQMDPTFALAHCNLGVGLKLKGQSNEAVAAFRRAIELAPQNVEAYSNLGACLAEQGRMDEAILTLRQSLRLRPDWPDAYFNLGVALGQQGQIAESIVAYRRTAQLSPDFAQAHHNLGAALAEFGDYEAAVAAIGKALQLKPDYASAHYNLGNALQACGRLDEAAAEYERAIELKPDYTDALNNLGNVHAARCRLDEAVATFRRALETGEPRANVNSNLIWVLQHSPDCEARVIEEEKAQWNRRFSDPVKAFVLPHANDRDPERRLRIGYVSPDLRDHTLGRNLLPLFRNHDHGRFEIVCYSGAAELDALSAEFRRLSETWRDVRGVPDDKLAQMIREDSVDILVDLSLHTAGNRLPVFARQPAPVQLSFAGYPESTGVEGIGYRISDPYLETGALQVARGQGDETDSTDAKWIDSRNERVFLIDSFWCYDPCGMEVAINALPARQAGYVTWGGLNHFRKVNDKVLKLWARLMAEARDSRLLLLSPSGSYRQRALEIMRSHGVGEERVESVSQCSRRGYLELYRRVDIMLDPFPYGGHTTSLDALWMGVPVVSLAGKEIVSRAGLSQLSNLGLPELVAHSEEEYVRIAADLARNRERLAELRATLRARLESSVLMNGERFARGIERAYRAMWRQWCRGEEEKRNEG